jgi:glutaredoxin
MKIIIRTLFKLLRILIGPFMLLWELLTRPSGIVRPPEQQRAIDQQCRQLALYQYKTCPFCIKVRQEMRRLTLSIEFLDAQAEGENRTALTNGGGLAKVPCLKITNASGQNQWLYESGAIITYLRGRFAPA